MDRSCPLRHLLCAASCFHFYFYSQVHHSLFSHTSSLIFFFFLPFSRTLSLQPPTRTHKSSHSPLFSQHLPLTFYTPHSSHTLPTKQLHHERLLQHQVSLTGKHSLRIKLDYQQRVPTPEGLNPQSLVRHCLLLLGSTPRPACLSNLQFASWLFYFLSASQQRQRKLTPLLFSRRWIVENSEARPSQSGLRQQCVHCSSAHPTATTRSSRVTSRRLSSFQNTSTGTNGLPSMVSPSF